MRHQTLHSALSVLLLEAGFASAAAPRPRPPRPEDVVARVDDVLLTRRDLERTRRLLMLEWDRTEFLPPRSYFLDRLIEETVLRPHVMELCGTPSGADGERFAREVDLTVRSGALQAFGVSHDDYLDHLRFRFATERFTRRLADRITEEGLRAEFDAHPDWYDGSRIRIRHIFATWVDWGGGEDRPTWANKKIDKCYQRLLAGKSFERIAFDWSDNRSAIKRGDRGWHERLSRPEPDELPVAAAWRLKVGEFTRPIRGKRGWHILKVTGREPARFTYFGSKKGVPAELARRRLHVILKELRAKAEIEIKRAP